MSLKINCINYNINSNFSITILQACEIINIHIPRFCYHDKLSIAGNCRMCFVELPKSKKPILACSTAVYDNIELFTNTFDVQKSQESVLEFLLLNHPLDCPVCDQGGECDLQELTKNFGSDRGRFNEIKRSVEDINLGRLIKTIMTRCIHCTRCIRYANEILNIPSLGTSGRGKDTEVSMYISKILESELSGNIIDLCPVGALTSKPYAFKARPWELHSIESIDIMDSIGSSIRVDIKGNEILRILPRINDSLNEEWITDKTRFSFDNILLQRYTIPSILKILLNYYIKVSWTYIICYMLRFFLYYKDFSYIIVVLGKLLDLESNFIIKLFIRVMPYNILINDKLILNNIRNYFMLNTNLNSLESREFYLIIESQLNFELPLLKLRIQKNNIKKIILLCGSYWKNSFFKILQFSNGFKGFSKILEGRLNFCYKMYSFNLIELFYKFKNYIFKYLHKLRNYLCNLKQYYICIYLNIIGLSSLNSNINNINSLELDLLNNFYMYNNFINFNNINKIINISFESEFNDINKFLNKFLKIIKKFNINFNYHLDIMSGLISNLIVPVVTFLEKKTNYLNAIGKRLKSNKVVTPFGKSWSFFKSIALITKRLALNKSNFNFKAKFINVIKFTNKIILKLSNIFSNWISNDIFLSDDFIYNNIFNRSINFFYCSNLLTNCSNLMNSLFKDYKILESNFFFYLYDLT